jgi:putative tryptophan/tyrosine transport system substrate-binding protein
MRLIGLAVVLTLGLTLAPLVAEAQQTEKVRRIGFLSASIPGSQVEDGLRQGLREHGYAEGRNLLIEWRFAEGRNDRLTGFVAEFVRLKVDVVVTLAPEAALAAKKGTAAIPIVFTQVPDPVALGLVSSLARPGGNLSGFSILAVDLTGKRLELFKEAVPSLKSAVLLTDRANPVRAAALKEAQIAGLRLGLETQVVEVSDPDELEPAFTTIGRERAHGLFLLPSSFFVVHRIQIAELATKRRLPVVAWTDTLALSGALMSYGPSTSDVLRRAGGHVAKILNGAKPGDLPVEQPTKLELVINLKTAKALGLTIPQSLLLRADQVIE